jgi:hypothetical protein
MAWGEDCREWSGRLAREKKEKRRKGQTMKTKKNK